jgi:hypothetical protein
MDFIRAILDQITPVNFFINAVLTGMLGLVIRLILKSFDVVPKNERLYWGGTLVLLIAVFMIQAIATERPKLHAEINTVHAMAISSTASIAVIIQATVFNTGSPSAISDWKLSVSTSGQTYVSEMPTSITKDMLLLQPRVATVPPYMIYASELITDKTAEMPIAKGGAAKGVIAFIMADVSAEDLIRPDTEITLSMRDVTGALVSAHRTRREMTGRHLTGRLPGFKSGPVEAPVTAPNVDKK